MRMVKSKHSFPKGNACFLHYTERVLSKKVRLIIHRMRKIEAELRVGVEAGFFVGDGGVKIRIDNHIQVPDQETVTCHDLLEAIRDADNGRDTDTFRQHTDLTVSVFLTDDKSDNIPEINQSGV